MEVPYGRSDARSTEYVSTNRSLHGILQDVKTDGTFVLLIYFLLKHFRALNPDISPPKSS